LLGGGDLLASLRHEDLEAPGLRGQESVLVSHDIELFLQDLKKLNLYFCSLSILPWLNIFLAIICFLVAGHVSSSICMLISMANLMFSSLSDWF
jgi:Leucine-rich repeat (LRR) protein